MAALGEYRNVLVIYDDGPTPTNMRNAQDADLVVFSHQDGTWRIWKDRYGPSGKRANWDDLKPHIKREVWAATREPA